MSGAVVTLRGLEKVFPIRGGVLQRTVAEVRESFGPQVVNRYNMYPSALVRGGPDDPTPAGLLSGSALRACRSPTKTRKLATRPLAAKTAMRAR